MTEEEKEAIEYFTKRMDICLENADICDENNFDEEAICLRKERALIEIVLNLIQRQDRQIDLMADTILEDTLKLDTYWCNGCSKTIDCPYKNPKDCIKQYFVEQKEV